ncbi:MAG: penicillin acylase family protein, partial [Chitinophagaceae bacterium]|nr:penicillin acylase family protein [Chitinophagaceae bacterium]
AYTVFGPVMYDNKYNGGRHLPSAGRSTPGGAGGEGGLAVRWRAHDPSNELKTFTLLDRAKDFNDYEEAIGYFSCPGQNFAFAAKTGDIAVWQQGSFPAKWLRQGDFIMPGIDESYNWQGYIPQQENPHDINPLRGFVSSANQWPADTTYPYYTGGHYDLYRGIQINRRLTEMNNITPEDMQHLQNDNYNVFAEYALPYLLQHVKQGELTVEEKKYFDIASSWNYKNDNEEKGPSVFTEWLDWLEKSVWDDELIQIGGSYERPPQYTLIGDMKNDSTFSFIDNISTPQKETSEDIVTSSFKKAVTVLSTAAADEKLTWNKFKNTGIRHLLRLEPLSRFHLNTGGGVNVINATKQYHGPSWKMIVQMTDEIEAYGIYPGGQSGNPGSKYYDIAVNDWAQGKYYRLWFMKKEEAGSDKIKHVIRFNRQ